MNATRLDDDFTSSVHVYEPHRAGLPRLGPYFRALWQRRQFAAETSRASMRAANTTTVFGQIWLVLNPLLLACVYFILVFILRGGNAGPDFFVHLVGGLFAFFFFSGALQTGASSVVGGGKLLLNMSFPRLLLPLAALRTAFFRFLPTIVVYFVIHLSFGQSLSWTMLLAPYFLMMLTLFGAGMGMIFATIQVYFRDAASFLPYMVRIWLYLSPVLWFPERGLNGAETHLGNANIVYANPLFSILGGWGEALGGEVPPAAMWIGSVAWAIPILVIGAVFFMSREREFVVRL